MLKDPSSKYRQFPPIDLPNRQWPSRQLTTVPVWCSTDLRDGNQALFEPMSRETKKRLFKTLTEIRSNTYKSWLCFGQSCEALGQYLEAANAYREVIKLKPDLPDVFSSLGKMLVKLS